METRLPALHHRAAQPFPALSSRIPAREFGAVRLQFTDMKIVSSVWLFGEDDNPKGNMATTPIVGLVPGTFVFAAISRSSFNGGISNNPNVMGTAERSGLVMGLL